MLRTIGWTAAALIAGGCNLNSLGQGSDTQAEPAQESSTGESEATPGTGSGASLVSTGGGLTSEGTTVAADDTTGSTATTQTSAGPMEPLITISDAEVFEFGEQDITTTSEHTFILTNEGNGEASALSIGGLVGAFAQLSTDCGSVLAPAATCEVVVGFTPELFGAYEGQLAVSYQSVGEEASVTRPLAGLGVGATANLIINGGGEQGSPADSPPVGWQAFSGSDWRISTDTFFTGFYSIHAGAVGGSEGFILFQSVDVGSLTNWGDASGVLVRMSARHTGLEFQNDPTQVDLRFSDASGEQLSYYGSAAYFGSSWTETTQDQEAPGGTQSVQVILTCYYFIGSECSGYFDEVQLVAEWAGP